MNGGARAFMTAYNSWNGIPMIVNPALKNVAAREWGQNGIICTDGKAFTHFWSQRINFPPITLLAAAAAVKAGITIFLDRYQRRAEQCSCRKIWFPKRTLTRSVKGNLRVMIKLGLLDPPDNNPYAKIGQPSEPEPWLSQGTYGARRGASRRNPSYF